MDTDTRVLEFPHNVCVNCGQPLSIINPLPVCSGCGHPVWCAVCREDFVAEDIIVTLNTTQGIMHVHVDRCAELVDGNIVTGSVGTWGAASYAHPKQPRVLGSAPPPPGSTRHLGAYGYHVPDAATPEPEGEPPTLPKSIIDYLRQSKLL